MTKRGPDGSGEWISSSRKVALAHRRLAVIGLGDQGAQPMELRPRCDGAEDPLVVTFNGEIYNFKESAHNSNYVVTNKKPNGH